MTKTIWRYRLQHNHMLQQGDVPTISALSASLGVGYYAAYNATRQLGLSCVSQEKVTETSYRSAAIMAAFDHPYGIATYEGIASRRGVTVETVGDFFDRHPELKKEWNVYNGRGEISRACCRVVAARWRKSHPGQKLFRKILAGELGWTVKKLTQVLAACPGFAEEIGVEYTYAKYGKNK